MEHRIRINGKVKKIVGELGSDIFDKHHNEIFSSDIISVDFGAMAKDGCLCEEWRTFPLFCYGKVYAAGRKTVIYFHRTKTQPDRTFAWRHLWDFRDYSDYLEIIGRVEEEK